MGTSLLNEPLSDPTEHKTFPGLAVKVTLERGISGRVQLRVGVSDGRRKEGRGSIKNKLSSIIRDKPVINTSKVGGSYVVGM